MIKDGDPNPYAPPQSTDLPPPPGRPILAWLTFGRGLALVFLALLLVTVSHVLFVEEMRLKRRSGIVESMDLAALAAFLGECSACSAPRGRPRQARRRPRISRRKKSFIFDDTY